MHSFTINNSIISYLQCRATNLIDQKLNQKSARQSIVWLFSIFRFLQKKKTRRNQDVFVISERQKESYVVRQKIFVVSTVFSIHVVNNHQSSTIFRKNKSFQNSSCFRFDISNILSRSSRFFRRRTEICVFVECNKTLHENLLTVVVQSQNRTVHFLILFQINDNQLRFLDFVKIVKYVYFSLFLWVFEKYISFYFFHFWISSEKTTRKR